MSSCQERIVSGPVGLPSCPLPVPVAPSGHVLICHVLYESSPSRTRCQEWTHIEQRPFFKTPPEPSANALWVLEHNQQPLKTIQKGSTSKQATFPTEVNKPPHFSCSCPEGFPDRSLLMKPQASCTLASWNTHRLDFHHRVLSCWTALIFWDIHPFWWGGGRLSTWILSLFSQHGI